MGAFRVPRTFKNLEAKNAVKSQMRLAVDLVIPSRVAHKPHVERADLKRLFDLAD